MFVSACIVTGRVILSSLAGYSLARIRFPGYKLVFGLILGVTMVPAIVLAIPRFLLLKELGMINTYAGLILPLVFDVFGIFLMKQFMEQIPVEIEEAAAIDGQGASQRSVRSSCPTPDRRSSHWPSSPRWARGTSSSTH